MAYKVGPKGQVVIAKEARERLGVRPGWMMFPNWPNALPRSRTTKIP